MADVIETILKWFETEPHPVPRTEPTINRDKQKIMAIVEECAHSAITGIAVADIVKKAAEIKIDEETTRRIVDDLVRDGFIYRPRHMHDMVRMRGPCRA